MFVTLAILKICAAAIGTLLLILAITLLLPLHLTVHEVNTDRKVKARVAIWNGLFQFRFSYPMEQSGMVAWLVNLGRRVKGGRPSVKNTPGVQNRPEKKSIWSSISDVRDRLPAGLWHQLKRSVKFDPWRGVITLGFENPALTGLAFGSAYNLIMSQGWHGLSVVPDFVDRRSQFRGVARIKIYPSKLIFLAVKHGFKTLKLFRSEKRR